MGPAPAGGGALVARLTIGEQVFEQSVAGMTNSQDGNISSTVNFDVPPEALTDEYLWATPQFGVPAARRPGGGRTPTRGL